jgi:hypothetical protein
MDAASTVVAFSNEERTLPVAGLAKTHLMARAIHVLFFECARGHASELGGADEIGFGEIDEAILIATGDAAGLAGEADAVHHMYYRVSPSRLELGQLEKSTALTKSRSLASLGMT